MVLKLNTAGTLPPPLVKYYPTPIAHDRALLPCTRRHPLGCFDTLDNTELTHITILTLIVAHT